MTSHFHAVPVIEQQCGANTPFGTQESFVFGALRGRKAAQISSFKPCLHTSLEWEAGVPSVPLLGQLHFSPQAQICMEIAALCWQDSSKHFTQELCPTWEFALWAVSLLDQEK